MRQADATKKSYYELLRDPRWQRKRLEIMGRDKFTCTDCGENDKQLHVHHLHYIRGREPWNYPDNLLITLCEECHKEYEKHSRNIGDTLIEELAIAGMTAEDISDIIVSVHNIMLGDDYRSKSFGAKIAVLIFDEMILRKDEEQA